MLRSFFLALAASFLLAASAFPQTSPPPFISGQPILPSDHMQFTRYAGGGYLIGTTELADWICTVEYTCSGGSGGVSSFNTRTGSVTLLSADVLSALGFTPANIASPTFTGTPLAPTAVYGADTTQLATTAFVQAALAGGAGVSSFNSRTGAISLISADVTGALGFTPLNAANNLSDVASASSARTNLGLGTAAVQNTANFLQAANNLSDLGSASTARTNLGIVSGSTPTTGHCVEWASATTISDAGGACTTGGGTVNSFNTRTGTVTLTTGDVTGVLGSGLGVAYGGFGGTSLTAHSVILGNGTSAVNVATPATSGYVLTSNGGSADPTWQANSPGALTLLATLTASSSATLSDTTHITSTYNAYMLVFEGITPSASESSLEIRFSINAGSSWLASGYTGLSTNYITLIDLYGSLEAMTPTQLVAVGPISGTLMLSNPNSSVAQGTGLSGTLVSFTSLSTPVTVGGSNYTTSPVNGIQFLFTAGNIASGVIKIYGVS